MLQEGRYTFVLQSADGAGSHVDHLFVLVGHAFFLDSLLNLILGFLVEESQQQSLRLFVRQDLEFVGVFDVHDFVADVVGSLYHIYQRMTGVF